MFPLARETRELVTYYLALALGVAALVGIYVFLRARFGLGLMAVRDSEAHRRRSASTSSAPSSSSTCWRRSGTGASGAVIYLNLSHLPGRRVQHQLDGLHDLHRGHRRHRDARRARSSARCVFFVLRELLADYGPGT